jgi:hypothetical protein
MPVPFLTQNMPSILQSPNPRAIPSELIVEILECVYFGDGPAKLDSNSISECTRVSHTWLPIARKLLFFDVSLYSKAKLDSFLHYIDSLPEERRLYVLGAVHILRTHVGRIMKIQLKELISLITILPCLDDLVLDIQTSDNLTADDLQLLRTSSSRTLKSLRIHIYPSTQSAVFTQLITCWPNLKSIEVQGHCNKPPQIPSYAPTFSLSEFRWTLPFFNGTNVDNLFSWVLSRTAPGELHTLELLELPPKSALMSLMDKHGLHIRSLKLGLLLRDQEDTLITALQKLSQLRGLTIGFNPSESVLQATPATIEMLAFRNEDRSFYSKEIPTIIPVVDAIRNSSFPRLRTVDYTYEKSVGSEGSGLQNVCWERGIEVRCAQASTMFR